jgi:hypothetical protein
MSAWIVTKSHIDALVTQLIAEGIIEPYRANEVGTVLWDENHYSVNVRYSEDTKAPEYIYEAPDGFNLDPAKVHTLIGCWQYQCAEWDGYDQTDGYKLLERLEKAIEAKYGSSTERGPWGIDTLEEAR